ncbi:MAG: WbqC family protein [Thaumarchaeota archaeon]|nr:WbqC family protein [Nitrososphaerota archaeon]
MIVSIHQPGYLPWLGFFKKISASDVFVFLDDVQYEKNGWHNRNKIRTSDGSIWLTVPIRSSFGTLLKEVKIDNTSNWIEKHRKSIQINYSKAKHFKEFSSLLMPIYEKNFDLLVDINMQIIELLIKQLEIKTKTLFSSELNISEKSSDRILEICKKLGATVYLSGALGRNYLNLTDFEKNGIEIQFQNFQHPTYSQYYTPFLPNMGAIDLVYNEGPNSSKILNDAKNF